MSGKELSLITPESAWPAKEFILAVRKRDVLFYFCRNKIKSAYQVGQLKQHVTPRLNAIRKFNFVTQSRERPLENLCDRGLSAIVVHFNPVNV